MTGQGRNNGNFNQGMVIGGTVLLLVGITALLPWIVEAVVSRLGAGSLSWQLAVRRLQLSSGTAARTVNGIAVAVAGAIALQMLFAGVQADYTRHTGKDLTRAQMAVALPAAVPVADAARDLKATRGVRGVTGLSEGVLGERATTPQRYAELTVGGCDALREVATLPSCRDGDTFVIGDRPYDQDTSALARPGRTVYVDPGYDEDTAALRVPWHLPRTLKSAALRSDPSGYERGGVLVTPGAFPATAAAALTGKVFVSLDPAVPDARELLRNAAARLDPLASPTAFAATEQSRHFAAIRSGLMVGATCVLVMIGASLLVSQLEQLRERRRLLSTLVAFGTRRSTLSLSVLWQTALPVALGLALASAVGIGLGAVLLRMVDTAVGVDWPGVAAMAGIAAGVVLLVTALSLPPLVRMMRPDGLRTE